MIKAVLFDLDNTLIDFVKMKLACIDISVKAMIKAGLPLSESKAKKKLIKIYRPSYFEDGFIFEKLLKATIKKIDYRILSAGIAAYRSIVNGYLTPYKGVVTTLKKLQKKGLKLGIVTDAPRLKGWIRLSSAGLAKFFPIVVTLGDAKKRKPSHIPFKKAIKKLGVNPDEILFVGDSIKKDIVGAKRLGLHTALAAYGDFQKIKPKTKYEIPDYTLNEFKDLLKVIK